MASLRRLLSPGLRGAFYYAMYWGAVGVYEPFLNVYYLRMGISGPQIGFLTALLPLFTILVAPFLARLADKRNWRVPILAVVMAAFAVSLVLLSIPRSFAFLMPVAALMSVFRCPIGSIGDSLVAQMANRHEMDYGKMRLWGSIVYAGVAILAGIVWQQAGFDWMMAVSGGAVLLVVGSVVLLEENATQTPLPEEIRRPFVLDTGIALLLAATFLAVASLWMSGVFLSVYMDQLGGGEFMMGLLLGVSALAETPFMLVGGRFIRRFGETKTLLLAYSFIAAANFGAGFANTPWLLLGLTSLRGLGFGLFFVSTVVIMNQRAPSYLSTTYQGLLNALGWGLAPLISAPLSGLIFEQWGPAPMFWIAGGVTTAAGLVILPTFWVWGKTQRTISHHPRARL